MATTVLFIEHLITGIQAGVWLMLLVLSVFGLDVVQLDKMKGIETLLTALIIALLYPIGVFVDNLADDLFKKWSDKIRKKHDPEGKASVSRLLSKAKDDAALPDYLGYIRTRIRISRSAALNFLAITITAMLFTVFRLKALDSVNLVHTISFILVSGICLTSFAIYSWFRITNTYFDKITARFDLIAE